MALTYNTYTSAAYLAAMDAADIAAGRPAGTTRKKIFTMEGMASIQAGLRTWTDKFVKDIVNNLPVEQYLDQTKTTIIPNFNWTTMSDNYPGATNPNLDGKPVLVFAIVGKPIKSETTAPDTVIPDTEVTTYSFIGLDTLIEAYIEDNDTTKGVDITISDNKISAEINLHTVKDNEAANIAVLEDDGLYIPEFDASEIEDRLNSLESTVGQEADEENSIPATGLVKAMGNLVNEIGVKANSEMGIEATGIYKYIDNATANIQDGLGYATSDDIDSIFIW